METNKQEIKEIPVELRLVDKLTILIDDDLLEATRGYNLKAARAIKDSISKLAEIVDDAIDDIHMNLGEHRASILSIVFSKIPGVYNIEWNERGVIKIHSMFPIDDSVVLGIWAEIKERWSEFELDKIMDEPRVLNTDSPVLSWRWVR